MTIPQKPSVSRIVHYVSHGTPVKPDGSQAYPSVCRAAIVTAVDEYQPAGDDGQFVGHVDLCVLNPTGMFFTQGVHQHDGGATPGDPNCPHPHEGGPFRYCPEQDCGWQEAALKGGTWHWPERV